MYNRALKEIVIYVPQESADERQVYQNYIMQVEKRDELKKYLEKKGIETKIHYSIPLHLQEPARKLGYKSGNFPVTEKLSSTVLTLPSSFFLKKEEIYYIIDSIKKFYKR